MPLYGQWSGSPRRFNALSCFNVRLDSPTPGAIYVPIMLSRRVAFPDFCEPCLPSPAEKPPAGDGWLHEIKRDGFRLMALKARVPDKARGDAIGVRLFSSRRMGT
jgi:hypothetical protein